MDAGESSDPTLLFTSEKSPTIPHDTDISLQPSTTPEIVSLQRAFFIFPPHISDEEKKLYKPAGASLLRNDSEMLLDEVIGIYREHNVSYYYARYQGGLAHKVRRVYTKLVHLTRFHASFPQGLSFKSSNTLLMNTVCDDSSITSTFLMILLDRKVAAGELEPFDPSAHYIEPSSRVKLTVSIKNRRGILKDLSARSAKPESETVPDSEEEKDTNSDSQSDDEGTDFEEEEHLLPRRTSGRLSVKRKQALPFSPKKIRSARVFDIESDLETGTSEKTISTRRSTRNSRRNRKDLKDLDSDADTDGADLSYGDDDAYTSQKSYPKIKLKKPIRKRESRTAYGHFRSVADLDYDSHSDEEIAIMWKHRDICEKCHRPPAHKLLQALSKRVRGRSKKKKAGDEFEESGDEEERLASLGGWLRW